MNPPPAPTSDDNRPINPPAPNMLAPCGNSRVGLGLRSNSICVAENPTNSAKNRASVRAGIAFAAWAPNSEPMTMPGASSLTTFQRTAPRA